MRRRNGRRAALPAKIIIILSLTVLAASAGFLLLERRVIGPNMEEVAELKASAVVSRAVNKALAAELKDEALQKGLFTEKRSDDGVLEMVQANSIRINVLMSKLSMGLQDEFSSMTREELSVPVGALFGSRFLSQTEPAVTLFITPMSVSSMDFRTEFETQGINQTKYKIYVVIECRVKIVAPFSSRIINTANTVLIAETVILGRVPENFVQVPKEEILDVT